VDRIDPIDPDRSVRRVELTYLTPIEREREKERRERERKRRRKDAQNRAAPRSEGGSGGLDVRA
jgi:hypothetical protein